MNTRIQTTANLSGSNAMPRSMVILIPMLILSVALNVMLARKVRELTNVQNFRMAKQQLQIGTYVPSIPAKRVDGQNETITYLGTERPTLLYIFTPQCIWCTRNLENLRTLVKEKSGEYRVIGLSLSDVGLEKYISDNGLSMPIYVSIPRQVRQAYKMGGTPQTIVVSSDGRVMQNWQGAYVSEQKAQVETFFRVTLPGISHESQ